MAGHPPAFDRSEADAQKIRRRLAIDERILFGRTVDCLGILSCRRHRRVPKRPEGGIRRSANGAWDPTDEKAPCFALWIDCTDKATMVYIMRDFGQHSIHHPRTLSSMFATVKTPSVTSLTTRSTPFQKKYLLEYGLRVSDTDMITALTISVRCQFCVYYGREQSVGQKRQREPTTTVKYWTSPFRAENYKKHHDSQHPTRWKQYQSLNSEEKQAHFSNKLQFTDTLHSHFGQKVTPLLFHINAAIIDIIIDDMFFHSDDHDGLSHVNALKLFQRNTESGMILILVAMLIY